MGVHGLWQLIEPSGRPVPLETLESKVLAVDVSIWLHQAVKGFQDAKGAPVPHAHLLGIYHRVCKLLYFKVRPIFVFDGGVPVLKKQTIAKRNQQNSKNISEAERLQKQLLSTLLKHSAVNKILSEKTKTALISPPKKTHKHENIYVLPPTELDSTLSSSESDETEDTNSSPTEHWDLHTIDMSSTYFKSLPVDVRHEILTDLKGTRKQSSWDRLHEIPKQSDEFSGYQMKRLLKRQAVQSALEDAEKEMGGHSLSLAELESILKDHGVVTINDVGKRIASDENTKFVYIKDVKQALEKARKKQQALEADQTNLKNEDQTDQKPKNKADKEFEDDLQQAIALSLQDEPSTSKTISFGEKIKPSEFSFLENFNDEDFQSDSSEELDDFDPKKTFSSAQNYMMEYSGLTPSEISKIMEEKHKKPLKKIRKKEYNKHEPLKIVDILDSDDSSEFVEVSNKKIQEMVRKDSENVANKVVSEKTENKTILVAEKLNNFTAQDASKEHEENITNDLISNEVESKFKDRSVPSVSSTIKEDVMVDNYIKTGVILENNVSIEDTTTHPITSETSQKIMEEEDENKETVEIMSDSDTSDSSTQFQDVSENKDSTDVMEIKINPEDMNEEDDLFSDIFNKNVDKIDEKKPIEIIINPGSKLDDHLFSDVFENKTDAEQNKMVTETVVESEVKETATVEADKNVLDALGTSENDKKIEEENVKIQGIQEHLSVKEMHNLRDDLQKEKIDLMVEKSTRERMATNITDQMYQEAQELLELFGVPYVVAPMEAEAQCAFLDAVKLTDGTITDDSDIWLFGGKTVYKNFFNQSKYVMEFRAENIKHHFKLSREQMILLALLVGSDYTTGIQGVGPVTAMEILAAFPPSNGAKEFSLSHAELLSGLKEFQSWMNKGKTAGPGRSSLKSKLKNVSIGDNFPSLKVVQAYMEPTVDASEEKFSWGTPDFEGLTDFARKKFGWSPKKTEEILKPVIKRMEEKRNQKSIKDFFKTTNKIISQDAKEKMSKRVKLAVERIGKTPEELMEEEMKILTEAQAKKTRKKNGSTTNEKTVKRTVRSSKKQTENTEESKESGNKDSEVKQKRTRRKTKEGQIEQHESEERVVLKKPRKKNVSEEQASTSTDVPTVENELQKYENIAKELRRRRQKKIDLSKITESIVIKKQMKNQQVKTFVKPNLDNIEEEIVSSTSQDSDQGCSKDNKNVSILRNNDCLDSKKTLENKAKSTTETIPEGLRDDKEVEFLQATVSRSLKRVDEIDQEVKRNLDMNTKKGKFTSRFPDVHKKEVIHQKLRDKSDLLKNKLKAIEVFRKSKKGPGYVEKRKKRTKLPKDDADLSESSSDE